MTDMLTHKQGRRRWLLIIVPFLAFYCSLSAGSLELSFNQVFALLLQGPGPEIDQTILWQIRLPRALLAALVGASLSLSGCTFQAVLRNPLGRPLPAGGIGRSRPGSRYRTDLRFSILHCAPCRRIYRRAGGIVTGLYGRTRSHLLVPYPYSFGGYGRQPGCSPASVSTLESSVRCNPAGRFLVGRQPFPGRPELDFLGLVMGCNRISVTLGHGSEP